MKQQLRFKYNNGYTSAWIDMDKYDILHMINLLKVIEVHPYSEYQLEYRRVD